MNVRGDTIINVIVWLAIVTVVLLISYWFFQNFVFSKTKIESVKSDLANVRELIDESCDTNTYKHSFNPWVEIGTLSVQDSNICIQTPELSFCEKSICTKPLNKTIDLGQITYVFVEKDPTTGELDVYGQ